MLYLVATPIGNLSDITFRAVQTLKECDLILCEDTRRSLTLLNHYEIKKPLQPLHQFNEQKSLSSLIERLKHGETLCMISDAGTPLISDPGYPLVKACIDHEIPFSALPGPCALIDALVLSGFAACPFQFVGFLPTKKTELCKSLTLMLAYSGTSIAYEAPHRILESLELIASIEPEREVCVARELTKKFESCIRMQAVELANRVKKDPPRGEIVLLIKEAGVPFQTLHPSPLVYAEELEAQFKIPKKEAIKIAAELCGADKRELYKKSFTD